MRTIRLATRGSPLARWQAEQVGQRLEALGEGLVAELVVVETAGDRAPRAPLQEVGGQGVFVKEVQAAVLEGEADVAVHSAKDLPSATPPGLRLAAVPLRGEARDALVGCELSGLAEGATVATGSVRRRAQLSWLRPDLRFSELRGNIETRVGRVPPGGAVVVALAALQRLGLADRAAEVLSVELMLPQAGQGAVAVECREEDEEAAGWLEAIDDSSARLAVEAERAYLARLGGGCNLPVAAHARLVPDGSLELEALLAAADGRVVLRESASTAPGLARLPDAAALGTLVAERLLRRAPEAGLAVGRAGLGVAPLGLAEALRSPSVYSPSGSPTEAPPAGGGLGLGSRQPR